MSPLTASCVGPEGGVREGSYVQFEALYEKASYLGATEAFEAAHRSCTKSAVLSLFLARQPLPISLSPFTDACWVFACRNLDRDACANTWHSMDLEYDTSSSSTTTSTTGSLS
eukprot:883333-Rhodomonas_salina.1